MGIDKDLSIVTGYEPQGTANSTAGSKRSRLVPADQVDVQVNVSMPSGIKWAVQDYQAQMDIPTMREAFIHLVKLGLRSEYDRTRESTP